MSSDTREMAQAYKGRFRRFKKLVRLVGIGEYRRGLRVGVAATVEHEAIPLGPTFESVIDVGAHNGQFALFARRRFPRARIYCVEPLPAAQRRLARVVGGMPDAVLLPVAAAAGRGERRLHRSRASDSSSLLAITNRYTAAFPGTEEVDSLVVQAERLDVLIDVDSLRRPALLKIDVQGGELDVLKGASELLRAIDQALVECSFIEFYESQPLADDIVAYMREHGFRLSGVYGLVTDRRGRCLQADFHFSRG